MSKFSHYNKSHCLRSSSSSSSI